MIAALVALLRPLLEPLLKIRWAAPGLPEQGGNVQHLKPDPAFLAYRYAGVMIGMVPQLLGGAVAAVALTLALGALGGVLGALILLAFAVTAGTALVSVRIDWELRDYALGERSLRIREGAWIQRELTLTYANIQNVEVTQGPLMRLFGFKSVRVTTAGGGRPDPRKPGMSTHEGELMGLRNAEEIRDQVLRIMRQHKTSGLGDPDEPRALAAHTASRDALLGEVRDAARALREAAEAR